MLNVQYCTIHTYEHYIHIVQYIHPVIYMHICTWIIILSSEVEATTLNVNQRVARLVEEGPRG